MKYNKFNLRFLSVLLALLISVNLYSQNSELNAEAGDKLYNLVSQKYGDDQVLVNGKNFENIYTNDLGHPYFLEDAYKNSILVIHNQKYENQLLKYNIWDQTLLIEYKGQFNAQTLFIPPNAFISEFTIGGQRFKKYKFKNEDERFFEEVYQGKISCVCFWQKKRDESKHNVSFMAHKFSEAQKKIYVEMHDKLYYLKNKKALVKLFPEHKKSIVQFMKQHQIKLYKASNRQLSEIMAYCENLAYN